tara:strand:- start:4721 stop:5287 length:567 start_codon:yes stop_codon:yes gene_type:complete
MSNIKILRLNNCSANPNIKQDLDRSGFSFILNQDFINNGRCLIEVISGWSNITHQGIDVSGDVNTTSRIVPNNVPNLIIRSNIVIEGEDILTGGNSLILGTMCLTNTTPASGTIAGSTSTNCASFNQNQSLSFICEKLPSQIKIDRLYLSHTTGVNDIPVFLPANNISLLSPPIVPMEVVLRLTFLDM